MNAPGLGSSSVIMGRGAEDLGMSDFFNLLAAQLTNQDMFDPQSNTEFIAQMAQFTTLRGMQILQENQLASHAASHVGKHVTIAHTNQAGNLTRTEGVVQRVTFYDGAPMVIVNGIAFPLFAVMEVHDPNTSGFGPEEPGDGGTVNGGPDLIGIPDLNTATSFIGKEVTLRYRNTDLDEYITITGIVEGVLRAPNGTIMFQLDNGHDYSVAYLIGVRQPEEQEADDY